MLRDINELKLSHIPAMQLLAKLGYEILPSNAYEARGSSANNVLLEGILEAQLRKINRIHYRDKEYSFSAANIQEAIQKLKNTEYDGRLKTHEAIYDLLTLPISLKQTIEGNSRSFDLNYIDWKDIKNNVFHAVPEFEVERTGSNEHARPDIVLFVNGIPLCVIECKSPNEEAEEAISQHIRNQGRDYIPKLFAYAQLLLAANVNKVRYATTGTQIEFWSQWQELEDNKEHIRTLINKPLSTEQKDALFCDEFARHRRYFDDLDNEGERLDTEQDRAIYGLCRPERLLDFTYQFTVFEGRVKKIARYQQFFVVRNALKRVKQYRDNKREGGIIWHTQGSGKSLTMVMLVRALLLDTEIPNPRILLVTDRTDLDEQLGNTFKACGLEKARATSGRNLVSHLKAKTSIITTLIQKFYQALETEDYVDDCADIFMLVDESHRTNFAHFAALMRKMLPNACYIGFTGTPLLKKDKNSFYRFGRLIEPHYSIEQAVKDKAILPLLYEGRLDDKKQNQSAIDSWFERYTADLTEEQKADLKRKYARANMLNKRDRVIYMRAYDISMHFRATWKGTGFKAQLVAPDKLRAIKYHNYLEEIGCVSSEVVISPPDMREGHRKVNEDSTDEVIRFWNRMMHEHGSAEEYEKKIIDRFKDGDEPEIIIVVDKLLTGFDAPKNTVLYLCKSLREHSLLQAIARVNRIYKGKDYGYVIDYETELKELDKALAMYGFMGFDEADIAKALISVNEEVDKLPERYSALWDIFKEVENKSDEETLERFLADKEKRDEFYECLTDYSNTLSTALSTEKFLREISDEELNRYKKELKNFMKLRKSVQFRYAEKIDFGAYEKKIEKLLDTHIHADNVLQLNEPIDILDKRSRIAVLGQSSDYRSSNTTAAQADRIAHRIQKTINEKMEEDPAFYEKFSELIQKAIDDFKNRKINEVAYLDIVTSAENKLNSKVRDDVPDNIKENGEACAYYGVLKPQFEKSDAEDSAQIEKVASATSLFIQQALDNPIVDFWHDTDAQNSVKDKIEDYLYDEVKAKFNIPLDGEQMDDIIDKVMQINKSRKYT